MCGDEISVWSERADHTNKGKPKQTHRKRNESLTLKKP